MVFESQFPIGWPGNTTTENDQQPLWTIEDFEQIGFAYP